MLTTNVSSQTAAPQSEAMCGFESPPVRALRSSLTTENAEDELDTAFPGTAFRVNQCAFDLKKGKQEERRKDLEGRPLDGGGSVSERPARGIVYVVSMVMENNRAGSTTSGSLAR
ncbi:hypothetical protein MRX96_004078 [Rhipicephalus microplus]